MDAIKAMLRRARADGHAVAAINLLGNIHQWRKDRADFRRRSRMLAELAAPASRDAEALVDFAFAAGDGFLKPMQNRSEILGLVRLIQQRHPGTVLELGTAKGGTLYLLAQAAADEALIVSVDLPFGRNGGGYPSWKEPIYRRFAKEAQRMVLLRANSHLSSTRDQVRAAVGARGFDLIMIDADHSYNGVRRDFDLYAPMLAPGGMIVLHDILENRFDAEVDVARFWAELKSERMHEEIVDDPDQGNFGIGIIFGDSSIAAAG